jgi:rhomboid family protein
MLAGCAFAAIWRRNLEINEVPPALEKISRPASVLPVGARRSATAAAAGGQGVKISPASRREWREEVDRILDKINRQGFDALDAEERRTLDRARTLLKK